MFRWEVSGSMIGWVRGWMIVWVFGWVHFTFPIVLLGKVKHYLHM